MKKFRTMPLFFGAIVFFYLSCNDATVIGSDLVSGEELDVGYTDTVSFKTYSRVIDTLTMYNADLGLFYNNFPLGDFQDPIFGKTTSSIYAQVTTTTGETPDFQDFILDSVVLILPYNTAGFYGDTLETYSVEVYEVSESLSEYDNFNSGMEFAVGERMGEASFIPSTDSISSYEPTVDSIVMLPAQLRIKLEGAFVDGLNGPDQSIFESPENFEKYFHGFYLKSTSINSGMVSFNLRGVTTPAGIKIYYRDTVEMDTSAYQFRIFSSQVVSANFQHDYSGSTSETYLGENAPVSDSLLFLQSLSGVNVSLEFPHLENLGNIVVNEAILEFPIIDVSGDPDFYFDPEQLIAAEITTDGLTRLIDDVTFASGDIGTFFGGQPEGGVYRMNISAFLQDAKQGTVNNKLEFLISLKPEKMRRVVLAGPKHATTPAKLKLTYTEF